MKKIIKMFFSFLGILFSCFLIWNRFIRERLPRDIYIHVFSVRFYITIVLVFGFILIISFSVKNIFSVDKESLFIKLLSNKYIDYIYKNIIITIKEGPEQLYELMYDSIKISFIIEPIQKYFFDYNIYNYCQYIILFLKMWRIIFVVAFSVDVFYFQEFYCLYKTIYVLIIPLICNFMLFIINHHAKILVTYLSEFVIADYSQEEKCFIIEKNPSCKENLTDNSIRHFGDLYLNALYTIKTFVHLKEMKEKINNYLNIYVYTLYSIGWLYCLYFSSNFYSETPKTITIISLGYLIISLLSFSYNFSLLIYRNKINVFIYNKKIAFYECLFMKKNNKHFRGFITKNIEKNILLFYCIFNAIPKYLIVVLLMLNFLITSIPYFSKILLCFLLLIFLSNLYLYFLNKYINTEITKLERYYYFITEENITNIYDKFPLEKDIISKKLAGTVMLNKWLELKERETFIYYSINIKFQFNTNMNSIFSGLLFITVFLEALS